LGTLAFAGDVSNILVAEGDSWFHYPGTDVLEELEDTYGYDIRSVAHRGDTLESMAYDERQLDGFNRKLRKLGAQGKIPRAVLFSGGGNDISGLELAALLNHSKSGLPPLNEEVVRGVIDGRLKSAYLSLIDKIGALCKQHFDRDDIPILVHGYDYPVPDGRGYWGGWGPLPGPWLKPSFDRKGYTGLAQNTKLMQQLIGRFNDMLASISLAHVHHVDLRETLSNDLTDRQYRDFWDNELHPEDRGFEAVAEEFQNVLKNL
jgi:hypothetical protein